MKERISFALAVLATMRCHVMALLIGIVLLVMILTGCTSQDDPAFNAPGQVVDRAKRSVTVLQDDGRTVQHRTSKADSRRCRIGERWPDC